MGGSLGGIMLPFALSFVFKLIKFAVSVIQSEGTVQTYSLYPVFEHKEGLYGTGYFNYSEPRPSISCNTVVAMLERCKVILGATFMYQPLLARCNPPLC